MKLREVGLRAIELETGPMVFLISHGQPVAYADRRPDAPAPGVYRTDRAFSKATTRHLNLWLKQRGAFATLPHDLIVQAFNGVSRFSQPGEAQPAPRPFTIGAPSW